MGVDDQSRQHLLLATNAEIVNTPAVTTLALTTRNLLVDGESRLFLDITCLFAALSEVFDHFAAAVIERISVGGEAPELAVEHVLNGWREFLIPPTGPPSRDKLAATLGELLVVRDAVKTEGKTDIGYWVGPFGQRHDIRSGPTAIEVKTTRSHAGYRITIHGEDQMLPPEGGSLHLHLVRLEEVPGGSTRVSAVVDELLGAGVSAQKLFSALMANGIAAADLTGTDDVTFEVRERVTLPVDHRTPRIVPDSFVGGKRPSGVVDVSYVVDLTSALASSLGPLEYQALLASLTLGTAL
ncbi:PD-(D/E)XK motif protein [Mycobacterium sp. pR1184]|uniref:PD-(D/E)XK motif protein n=1 Tax=Mycobacterium sp. pR1184 TaxID=3238981 RepID=UPI00351BC18D